MAAALAQRFGKLDIFVSCAAVLGQLSPAGHYEPALWQEIIDVNLTANWRLIRALDPLLRAAPAGRAIFATCAAARAREPFWAPYAASKAGLEALVKTYAEEIAHSSVRANLVDPGPMRTALRFAAFPFEDRDKIKPPEDATEAFVDARRGILHEERRALDALKENAPRGRGREARLSTTRGQCTFTPPFSFVLSCRWMPMLPLPLVAAPPLALPERRVRTSAPSSGAVATLPCVRAPLFIAPDFAPALPFAPMPAPTPTPTPGAVTPTLLLLFAPTPSCAACTGPNAKVAAPSASEETRTSDFEIACIGVIPSNR